jgi:saccharopine dehydrogenase-like NADP-dependent oxidoreductase
VGRDLVMLQHKFVGDPTGHSAMALTVGLPCGIASQLVLDGVFKAPGVQVPYTEEACDPIQIIVENEGLGLVEKVL